MASLGDRFLYEIRHPCSASSMSVSPVEGTPGFRTRGSPAMEPGDSVSVASRPNSETVPLARLTTTEGSRCSEGVTTPNHQPSSALLAEPGCDQCSYML